MKKRKLGNSVVAFLSVFVLGACPSDDTTSMATGNNSMGGMTTGSMAMTGGMMTAGTPPGSGGPSPATETGTEPADEGDTSTTGDPPDQACKFANDDVCDELDGVCAEGTDWFDCGYCPSDFLEDTACDAPALCPAATDLADCGCPDSWIQDDVCDEKGVDACAPDTDWFDCGYCPDVDLRDGVCDEIGKDPRCPPDTDIDDCTCDSTNDGECDEPGGTGLCAPGTDTADCA